MTLVPECASGLGPPRLPGFQLLRDTFAGKILITFSEIFFAPQKSEKILPAKVSRSS